MQRARSYLYLSHWNGTAPEEEFFLLFLLSCTSAMMGEQPAVVGIVMAAGSKWGLGGLALL